MIRDDFGIAIDNSLLVQISPEGCTSKHAQQSAIAADALLGEIGKCCRDFFTQSHKSDKKLPPAAVGKAFRLKDISAYWLISPLLHACPRPGNLPASFPAITVQGKFLKEAAAMLDTSSDNNKERIQQRYDRSVLLFRFCLVEKSILYCF
ncbi:unnamed protein product [Onchocerca flexuosa]|uniref:Uncharacterized protein n=1 Tax=Onchocerca flexuosa TaxID=387005 RepID=A0A3P8C821_9BILA|nr:unnamed protein product [Onchocerca flexuosa]